MYASFSECDFHLEGAAWSAPGKGTTTRAPSQGLRAGSTTGAPSGAGRLDCAEKPSKYPRDRIRLIEHSVRADAVVPLLSSFRFVIAFDLTPLRSHHLAPQLRMIKKLYLTLTFVLCAFAVLRAQVFFFRGLDKAMDSETYSQAWAELTAEERTVLDDFIRGYVAGKQKAAANAAAADAVERAVKENKVNGSWTSSKAPWSAH